MQKVVVCRTVKEPDSEGWWLYQDERSVWPVIFYVALKLDHVGGCLWADGTGGSMPVKNLTEGRWAGPLTFEISDD